MPRRYVRLAVRKMCVSCLVLPQLISWWVMVRHKQWQSIARKKSLEFLVPPLLYLAENGMFKFYDTFTNIGRTNVRYKKQTEDLYYNEAENIATFKLTLRVTDPVTQVTLTETT